MHALTTLKGESEKKIKAKEPQIKKEGKERKGRTPSYIMSRQSSIHSSGDGDDDLHLTDDEIEDLDAQLAGLDLSANFAMSMTKCDDDDDNNNDKVEKEEQRDEHYFGGEDDGVKIDPLASPPPSEIDDEKKGATTTVTEKTSPIDDKKKNNNNEDHQTDDDQTDDKHDNKKNKKNKKNNNNTSASYLFHHIFKKRLDRDEVFSKHYTATTQESKEVSTIAKSFGIRGTQHALFDFHSILCMRGKVELIMSSNHTTTTGKVGAEQQQHVELFLLTHGYILARVSNFSSFTGIVSSLVQSSMMCCEPYSEVEYIRDQPLLLLATTQDDDESQEQQQQQTFIVKTKTQEYRMKCPTYKDKLSWLYAWERVIIKDRCMTPDPDRSLGWQHEIIQTSLWSAAVTGSAATLGIIADMKKKDDDHDNNKDDVNVIMDQSYGSTTSSSASLHHYTIDLNQLDTYNSLGILHYAVLYNQIHVLEHVLEQDGRAYADLKDGQGRTPMYYAQRDENEMAIQILRDVGHAQYPCVLWEQEQQGMVMTQQVIQVQEEKRKKKEKKELEEKNNRKKLFGETASSPQTPRTRKKRLFSFAGIGKSSKPSSSTDYSSSHDKQLQEQQQQAQTAKSQMAENLQLLAERGEKINDLQEKTDQLQDGISEYATLAKQLKEQTKKKKWYRL